MNLWCTSAISLWGSRAFGSFHPWRMSHWTFFWLSYCISEDSMDGLQPFSTYDSYFCEQRRLCDVLTAKICIWLILDWCDQGWFCLFFFFSFQNLGWDSGRYSSVCCVLLSCMWCHSDVINLFIWDTWFFSFYVIVLSW